MDKKNHQRRKYVLACMVILLFLLSFQAYAMLNRQTGRVQGDEPDSLAETVADYNDINGCYAAPENGALIPVYYNETTPVIELNRYYIPWYFSVYAGPDFRAQIITVNAPQYIEALDYCAEDEGWALVATAYGDFWVYINANRRFIERKRGLFENKGDEYTVGYIEPQTVNILGSYDDWLLVDTDNGAKWLYLNFFPDTRHLDALLRPFGHNLSVFFYNAETGFYYTHNEARRYFSASVTKAFFSLYIYQKAERGEVDLDSYITFTRADILGGAGVILQRYSVGTDFTQRELLRKNLMYSDNVATLMLRRVHGTDSFREFAESLGANPNNVRYNVFNSVVTIPDAGIFMRAIHDYIESGGRYSEEFRQHLINNQRPFIVSDYVLGSKSGWTYPYAWHDMAIIYAPSPYILVILSRDRSGTSGDFRVFADISMAFQEFNDTWFTY